MVAAASLPSAAAFSLAAGAACALAAWLVQRNAPAEDVKAAVARGGAFKARLTGYWPFAATSGERALEGGIFDRKMPDKYKNDPESPQYKAHVLHTLEQHLADPVKHPHVSVSGDDAVFPYGQRLEISAWPGAVFRVVDTGGNFRGAAKKRRSPGREPLDICVASSKTRMPVEVEATLALGDHFDAVTKTVNQAALAGSGLDCLGVD